MEIQNYNFTLVLKTHIIYACSRAVFLNGLFSNELILGNATWWMVVQINKPFQITIYANITGGTHKSEGSLVRILD